MSAGERLSVILMFCWVIAVFVPGGSFEAMEEEAAKVMVGGMEKVARGEVVVEGRG